MVRKYIAVKEPVFAAVKDQLDDSTFAALVERRNVTALCPDRYVAVIDCRGDKGARLFFTKWHEIAHLLTLTRQLELPFHRSTSDRSPLERLMDAVAGDVGFYGPVLYPALAAEVKACGKLSFELVDRIRQQCFPEASFHATLNACVARADIPAIVIEARLAHKKSERKDIASRQLTLIELPKPEAQLRAVSAVGNDAARRIALRIDPNMCVPAGSLIHRQFYSQDFIESLGDATAEESLARWRHSDGKPVGAGQILVQARKVRDTVLALVQLA